MGTLKNNSDSLVDHRLQTRRRHLKLFIGLPLILLTIFAACHVSKLINPYYKHNKDLKHDIKRLETRLIDAEIEVQQLTFIMVKYQDALYQLQEDFNSFKQKSMNNTNHRLQSTQALLETVARLDTHDDTLNSLSNHIMLIADDLRETKEKQQNEASLSLKQRYEAPMISTTSQVGSEINSQTNETQTSGKNPLNNKKFVQLKNEISEALKENLLKGKEMSARIVTKAKDISRKINEKFEETSSKVIKGAKKTKEFIIEKGGDVGEEVKKVVKTTTKDIGKKTVEISSRVKEQAKKLADNAKYQAERFVEKTKDLKDSFMKMFG